MADKKARKNIVQVNQDELIDLTGLRAAMDAAERQHAPVPMPEAPSMARSIGDSGIALGSGLVTGVKLISDAFGADNPVSRTLGEANQGMQGLLSPYRQAELQNRARLIAEAEGSGSTAQEIGAYLGGFAEAPVDTMLNVAGTAAPTMASMLIPGAREANVARLLGVGTGAIQGAGAGKSSIYDAVLQKKLQEGVPEAEARAIADAAQSYGGDNTDTILANTALGAVAGGSGLESAARALKYGKAAQAAPGLTRRVGTGVVVEGLPEAGQGGMEQASANIALQREGYDVPTMRGVAGSAALEGVAGGALGGAFAIPSPSEPAADVPPAPIVPVTGPLTKAVNAGAGPVANAASQANANALAEMDKLAQEEGGAEQAPAAPADPLKAYRATPQPTPEQAAQAEQALAAEADQNELAGMESAGRSPQPGNLAGLDAAPSQSPAAPAFASLDEADDYVTAQQKLNGSTFGVPIQNEDGSISLIPKTDARYVQAAKDRQSRKKARNVAKKESKGADTASALGAGSADGTGVSGDPGVAGEPAIDAGNRPADAGQPVVDPEQRSDAVQPGRGGDEALSTGPIREFQIGGRDPHTITFEHREDGRLVRTITYPDGETSTESLVTDKAGDEHWVSTKRYEKGEFYPLQLSSDEASSSISLDLQGRAAKEKAPAHAAKGATPAPTAPPNEALTPSMVAATKPQPTTTGPAPITAQPAGTRGTTAADVIRQTPQAKPQAKEPTGSIADDMRATQARWDAMHARADKVKDAQGMADAIADFENGGEESAFDAAITAAESGAKQAADTEAKDAWTRAAENDRWGILAASGWKGADPAKPSLSAQRMVRLSWDKMSDSQRTRITQGLATRFAPDAQATPEGTGTQATQAPADQAPATTGSDAGRAEQQPVDAGAGSAPVEADGVTAKIERAKRRLRENRNKQATTGVREELTKLKAQEQDIEREIRSLRQQAVADEPAPAPAPATAPTKGLGAQLAELNAELERQGPVQNANTRAKRDAIRKQIAEQDFPDILRAVDDDLATAEELNAAFKYAGDEPKAKTIARIFKKRGITDEYAKRWTERLLGADDGQADDTMDDPEMAAYEGGKTGKTRAQDKAKVAEDAAKAKAQADLDAALGDLGDIFGKNTRLMMMPEQEQKLLPVLTRVLDAAFRLGYYKFKDAARFALNTIRAKLGAEVADSITLDHLQGAYIGMAGKYQGQGADSKRDVINVESLSEIAETNEQDNNEPTTAGGNDASPSQAERVPASDPQPDRGDAATRSGDRQPLDARVASDGPGSDPVGGVPASPEGPGAAGAGSAGQRNDTPPRAPRNSGAVRPDGGAAESGGNDFDLTGEDIGTGGLARKYKDNIAAIRILKAMDLEGRVATPDERKQLARYVGWGALKAVFDPANAKWAKQHAELKELLTEAEWKAARASTLNAHYTDKNTVSAMFDALAKLGFKSGRVLEPSVGSGNFFGMMPAGMRNKSSLFGIELDPMTAKLAQALYPSAKVKNSGFEDFEIPSGYFDVVIGNPPFGSEPIKDAQRSPYSGFSIHNYFLAKAIDKLRPGGLMQVVVSHNFLDAQDGRARKWIGERANLIGAVRLPNTAFKENAGTVVVTDILIFQKKVDGVPTIDIAPWQDVVDQTNVNEKTGESAVHKVNQFFTARPDLVLGTPSAAGTMRKANEYTVQPSGDLTAQLGAWVQTLPENVYEPVERGPERAAADVAVPDGIKVGSFFVDEKGRVMTRGQDDMGERTATAWAAPNGAADKRVRGMIALRDLLRRQMRLERDPASSESDISANRAELSKQYDAFLKGYGHLNSQANRRLFLDDPEAPLLQALELDYDKGVSKATAEREDIPEREPSASKADIFSRRVVFPPQDMMAVSSAKDALLASLNFKGRVDMDYMATVYDKSPAAMLNELGDVVFDDPQAGLVMADEYLSGDVKTKLAEAEAAARDNPALRRNVEALRAVIPADKKPSEITVSIGAAFVPEDVYRDFFKHITGGNLTLGYLKATGQWLTQESGQMDAALNRGKFGTPELSASDLFQLSMLGRGAVVKKTTRNADGSTTTVVLEKETEAARAKQEAIKAEWKSWLWKDGERANRLSTIYNEKMNRLVPRKFDGSHLQFPGMSPAITLLEHQKNGVWRGLQTFQTLYDHVVGAGKTFEMATLAMEMRRLGIARKPIFVVPNHLTLQWRSEFTRLYPTSNVLAATPEDFGKGMREKMFSKIVTGDWDAVIIGHSSLKKIGLPIATETAIMQEQIDEISDAIEDMKRSRGDRNIVGDMERIRKTLEGKLKEKLARLGTRDKVLTFDELGLDAMFVDEMHEFKNLTYTSTMDRVPGMGNPKGSDKSFDLFVKLRWLFDTFGKKAPIITATGTPVSNSLVEMYNMQRFMQYPTMKELGTHVFDAWARQFGSVESVYEVSPSGTGFRQSTRFAKFTNLSALMGQYNSFADVITLDDLKQQAADRGERFPVPKVAGGRPKIVVAERSPQVAEFMGVPRVQTGEDGALQFLADVAKDAPEFSQDTNGKWVAKVGQAQFANLDTLEDAKLKVVEKALTPNVAVDPKSILGQFGNLRQLTKESKGKINALSLTGQANKAGLDYRLIDPSAPDFKGSKINLAVDEAMALYKKWSADKGAQLIFCDLSIPLSARANVGAKAVRVYVRGTEGLAHKRGTLHAIEGFEGLPFIITEQGAGAAKQFDLYDAASGVLLRSGFKSKQEAKDKADSLLRNTPMRDKWLLAREEAGEIEQEQIDEYNDLNEIDTEESASITRADIAGMSGDSKFSVYDDIKAKLIARGVPEREIAFIHDYDTPTAKAKLFRAVNKGDVRFLLGSTPKMGAGTNVQERLVGLHHIDAPWRPSDLEQREGRIIRRGSALYERDPDNYEVEIFRYATSQTYDTRRWQILEHKAKGIEQLRNFDGTFNEIEDIAGEAANSADMKAAASGDPLILEETRLRNDVRRLEQLEAAHADNVVALGKRAETAQANAERFLPARLESRQALSASLKKNPVPKDGLPAMTVNGARVADREAAVAKIQEAVNYVVTSSAGSVRSIVYRGVSFYLEQSHLGHTALIAESTQSTIGSWGRGEAISPTGLLQRLANYADRIDGHIEETKADIKRQAEQAVALRKQSKEPWGEQKELEKAREEYRRVQRALIAKGPSVPDDQKAALKAALELQRKALIAAGLEQSVTEFMGSASSSMFSRASTGKGVPMRDAQAAVGLLRREMPNAPDIVVLENLGQAPEGLQNDVRSAGAEFDWEAAYYEGRIYVMPDHIADMDRFMFVVGRHEVRHAGFDAILGDQKEAILLSIGRANRRVMREAKQKMADGLATSEVEAIEEALADMPVEDVAALTRIKVLVAAIRRWLRATAFKLRKAGWRVLADSIEPKTWTDNDVIAFVFKAEGVSRGPGGGSRFSRDNNQPFYSELRKQIAGASMNAAPAKGWSDTLKGMVQKGQVKQDEIEWTGLGDWLALQEGKVTKEAVLGFLAANGVQVQEVTLSDGKVPPLNWTGEWSEPDEYGDAFLDSDEGARIVKDSEGRFTVYDVDGEIVRDGVEGEARAKEIAATEFHGDGDAANSVTKYGRYTLPGGENYREVLLTLPERRPLTDAWRRAEEQYGKEDPRTIAAKKAARAEAGIDRPKPYKSSHWNQPNVIAHIRLNDRTDADGNRVLFVEEVQSDWGQEGKKRGFKADKLTEQEQERYEDLLFKSATEGLTVSERREYQALNDRIEASEDPVPSAPFVTKTDGWLNLALKRIIKMAADGGYDRVAFITGEQSAERYDLSKQVEELMIEREGDSFTIAMKPVGQGYSNGSRWSGKAAELPDVVGKELADKVASQPEGRSYMRGLDLKVGGEGMKAFYDQIVPNAAKALLKKLGGGQMATVPVSSTKTVSSRTGPRMGRWDEATMLEQPGFDVTPAMRDKAAGGMPLFSRAKVVTNDEGHPEFQYGDIKLAFPLRTERIEVIEGPGQSVMSYAIMPAEGFDVLGHVELLLENGRPVSLLDIVAYEQGKGAGRKAVEALLRTIPGDLNISNIVPEAQGFWERMGVPVQNLEEGAAYDGTLNLETYLEAQDGEGSQGDPRRAGGQGKGTDARAKAGAPGAVQGRQVSARFSRRNSLATLREAGARKAEAVRDANLFAGYKVGDFMQSTGRLSWWDKSIGTPFNLAKRYPGTFGRVFNAVQDFLNDVSFYGTEAANLAPTLLPKLDKLRDITKSAISAADNRAISAPIFDGTLNWTRDKKGRPIRMEQAEAEAAKLTVDEKARELLRSDLLAPGVLKMWQGLPLDQYEANVESRYASQLLRPGIVFTPDELRSIFKLTQAQAGLYKEFRASVDRSLDDLTVSEITRLVRNEWPGAVQGEGQSAEDFAEEVRQALMDMESRDTADKVAAMANRLTDLKAKGYAPLSRFGHFTLDVVDADGERVYFGLFESQSEANMKARQMREQFPQATVTQGTQSQEAYKMLAGVSPETIELFGEILGLDATGDKESDKAFQEYLKKAKSTRSAMKRLIHRKGIAGFSEDSGRVLAGFITSNARRTSSNHHLKGIMDAVDAMPREQGELKDYAARMAEYVNSPVEEAQALRGLMFAQYLGGSVASALVNMTQPIAVTLPFLSQHTTAAKAAKLVTGAMADMASRKKLETGLENALKLAEEKGIVAPQEVHYLQAQASGSGALVSGDGTKAGDAWAKAKNGWSRLSFGWGKLFGFAELVNRRATFIASYRLAVQNKYPDPFKFASDAVEETQFVYNKGNRPEWARGAIGATLFTFKTYSISYVELLSRMWKLGGPEGKKALALALATMILMSGVDELPFMEDIEDVIDGVAQRVFGLNWQTKAKRNEWAAEVLGKDLAAFLARGVSGVPGVPMDVSGRLGMGNLLPGTGLFRKDSQDPARDVAEIAGPVGDLLKRGFTAAGMAAQGDLTKAALEVSPVAIRNVAKAADMADSGIYTDSGGKKVIETTAGEAILKGIGFQPNAVAKVQDASVTKARMIGLNKKVEAEIADLWAQGRFENDPAKVDDARNRLKDWNRQNPDSPIRIQQGQIQKRVKAMRMSKAERIAKTAPKEIRADVRRDLAEVNQ